jgi:hypothetical protein
MVMLPVVANRTGEQPSAINMAGCSRHVCRIPESGNSSAWSARPRWAKSKHHYAGPSPRYDLAIPPEILGEVLRRFQREPHGAHPRRDHFACAGLGSISERPQGQKDRRPASPQVQSDGRAFHIRRLQLPASDTDEGIRTCCARALELQGVNASDNRDRQ